MGKKLTQEEFIARSKEVHGDIYDYSLVDYKGQQQKVKIICPKHGVFEQYPQAHTKGHGCKKCTAETLSKRQSCGKDEFIRKAKEVHGDKYDYSEVVYKNNASKVKIICPKHGVFEQTPANHVSGYGCPLCAGNKKLTLESFIQRSIEKHGDRYDYSKVVYKNIDSKVEIICKQHGSFYQTPYYHMKGEGCPHCCHRMKLTSDNFIERAKSIHGDKYDYSKVEYKTMKDKIIIICPKHGEFLQTPEGHLSGYGCPECSHRVSNQDLEIANFIKSFYNGKVLNNITGILSDNTTKELDVYIPEKKIAIEHTGLYFHSVKFSKNLNHLKDKYLMCEKENIKLFTIYSDEWANKKDIVKSMISNALGYSQRIYARKTEVRKIEDSKIYSNFLDENHIQGKTAVNFAYGLYYNNELVSVMTFTNPRMNMGRTKDKNPREIELSRFCNKINMSVIGGASKLLKAFISEYGNKYNIIYSYSDNRISNGGLYKTLGFSFTKDVNVNYFYTKGTERKPKQQFRKSEFKKRGIDVSDKTEVELALDDGWFRIYDCGKKLWTLNIN